MIQYLHVNPHTSDSFEDPGTFAIKIEEAEKFKTLAKDYLEYLFSPPECVGTFLIGRSRLHPKDKFEKAKGRLAAVQNMTPQLAQVVDMHVNQTRIKLTFESEDYIFSVSVSRGNNCNVILRGINEKDAFRRIPYTNLCGVW